MISILFHFRVHFDVSLELNSMYRQAIFRIHVEIASICLSASLRARFNFTLSSLRARINFIDFGFASTSYSILLRVHFRVSVNVTSTSLSNSLRFHIGSTFGFNSVWLRSQFRMHFDVTSNAISNSLSCNFDYTVELSPISNQKSLSESLWVQFESEINVTSKRSRKCISRRLGTSSKVKSKWTRYNRFYWSKDSIFPEDKKIWPQRAKERSENGLGADSLFGNDMAGTTRTSETKRFLKQLQGVGSHALPQPPISHKAPIGV